MNMPLKTQAKSNINVLMNIAPKSFFPSFDNLSELKVITVSRDILKTAHWCRSECPTSSVMIYCMEKKNHQRYTMRRKPTHPKMKKKEKSNNFYPEHAEGSLQAKGISISFFFRFMITSMNKYFIRNYFFQLIRVWKGLDL